MNDSGNDIFPLGGQVRAGRKLVLEFESFRSFIEAFSPVVSEEGMFVSDAHLSGEPPVAEGDPVDFQVRLTDDFWLIRGSGEIAWRRPSGDPSGEPGVAVRFKELDDPSRRLVGRLVSNYAKEGGVPFDLKAVPPPPSASAVEPEPLERTEADALFSDGGIPELEVEEDLTILPVEELPIAEPPADELPVAKPLVEEPPVEEPTVEEPPMEEPDLFEAVPILPTEELADESAIPQAPLEELVVDDAISSEATPLPEILGEPEELGVDRALEEEEEEPVEPPEAHLDAAQIADEALAAPSEGVGEMVEEESSTVAMAGAGVAKPERSLWPWLVVASLVGVAVGVLYFFYGDRVKSLVGLSVEESVEAVALPESGPELQGTAPTPPEPGDVREEAGSAPAGGEAETVTPETAEAPVGADLRGEGAEAATPEAEALAQLPPATRVERITWRERDGSTIVTIELDGGLTEASYEVVQIRQGEPRELIKILGIREPFLPRVLEVGDPRVQQLRTGLHRVDGRNELHIVADLASPETSLKRVRIRENNLVLTFS